MERISACGSLLAGIALTMDSAAYGSRARPIYSTPYFGLQCTILAPAESMPEKGSIMIPIMANKAARRWALSSMNFQWHYTSPPIQLLALRTATRADFRTTGRSCGPIGKPKPFLQLDTGAAAANRRSLSS